MLVSFTDKDGRPFSVPAERVIFVGEEPLQGGESLTLIVWQMESDESGRKYVRRTVADVIDTINAYLPDGLPRERDV